MAYVTPTPREISDLVEYLKQATGLPALDGSEARNRGWARQCVSKFQGIENVKLVIVAAMKDEFHHKNVTSFVYLLNHGMKIMTNQLYKRPRGSIIE